MRRRVVAAIVLATLAACSDKAPPREGRPLTFEDVSLGASLAKIRGHHLVGLELSGAGDPAAALVHAEHPIAESTELIGRIRRVDAGAAADLGAALETVARAIKDHKPASEVSSSIDAAARAGDEAEAAVLGSKRNTAQYRGSVLATVLSAAAQEYGEAVHARASVVVAEYQDAYGFVRVAAQMFTGIEAAVQRAGAIEAREIAGALARLRTSLPTPAPPERRVRFEDVRNDAVLVAQKISETVGAVLAPARTPREVVASIRANLDRALAAYEAGNAAAAADLVTEAYLKDYEVIELDVARLAGPVNAELEPLLSSRLPERVKAGAPAADVRRMIDRAKALVDQAQRALER